MIFAYLDPGAGSMLFQAALAAALSLPLLFRSKIAHLYGRIRRPGGDVPRAPGAGSVRRR